MQECLFVCHQCKQEQHKVVSFCQSPCDSFRLESNKKHRDPDSEPTLTRHATGTCTTVLRSCIIKAYVPENTVVIVTKSNCNPRLERLAKTTGSRMRIFTQGRVVYLLKSRVNTECLETCQRGSSLVPHTNYNQLRFIICKCSPQIPP